ncbi:MAG TPA: hypothetical protein VFF73_22620 [Planctomycetota bacterium]|nr:hypothetical protein [Planctomycetota bacterium]
MPIQTPPCDVAPARTDADAEVVEAGGVLTVTGATVVDTPGRVGVTTTPPTSELVVAAVVLPRGVGRELAAAVLAALVEPEVLDVLPLQPNANAVAVTARKMLLRFMPSPEPSGITGARGMP